jgi:hypothetical protein
MIAIVVLGVGIDLVWKRVRRPALDPESTTATLPAKTQSIQ